MDCNFRDVTTDLLFHGKQFFRWKWREQAALIALLYLLIIYWSLSKNRHRKKNTCSELNPVQSSRSKLTTSVDLSDNRFANFGKFGCY